MQNTTFNHLAKLQMNTENNIEYFGAKMQMMNHSHRNQQNIICKSLSVLCNTDDFEKTVYIKNSPSFK